MYIDTHCHLWNGKFCGDLEQVVERARKAGVAKMVVPGTEPKTWKGSVELSKKYSGEIWAAVGWYPGEMRSENIEIKIEELRKFVEVNREYVVAIGEMGLDRYYLDKQPELENEVFRRQMELATELELPVVVHNRGCDKEIKQVLESMDTLPRGHFHCFSGDQEWMEYLVSKGFYVGFCGNVTYKANVELRETLKKVPADRLLLETDAPYLPPQGKRGERNEPCNVRITATYIAETRGVSLEEIERQTSENARELYKV